MQILKQTITDFTYSNLTETIVEYNPATTYAVGNEVRIGAYTYKSVIAGNVGNNPEDTLDVKWVKWGVSNKFSMLDLASGTKSVKMGASLIVEFEQNNMDTLVIGNYEASNILVEILDTDDITVLWSYQTEFSINNGVDNWYDWTYQPYGYEIDRALMVKLGFVDATTKVRVTFVYENTLSDRTSCGYLLCGKTVNMGESLYGVGFKFNSFTTKEFDTFGTFKMVKRSVQDLVNFNTCVKLNEIPLMTIKRNIKAHYDTIVAFIVDESVDSRFENMITLGIIQDVDIALNNGVVLDLAWSVQEVI